jgi:hypothetical protein
MSVNFLYLSCVAVLRDDLNFLASQDFLLIFWNPSAPPPRVHYILRTAECNVNINFIAHALYLIAYTQSGKSTQVFTISTQVFLGFPVSISKC